MYLDNLKYMIGEKKTLAVSKMWFRVPIYCLGHSKGFPELCGLDQEHLIWQLEWQVIVFFLKWFSFLLANFIYYAIKDLLNIYEVKNTTWENYLNYSLNICLRELSNKKAETKTYLCSNIFQCNFSHLFICFSRLFICLFIYFLHRWWK